MWSRREHIEKNGQSVGNTEYWSQFVVASHWWDHEVADGVVARFKYFLLVDFIVDLVAEKVKHIWGVECQIAKVEKHEADRDQNEG